MARLVDAESQYDYAYAKHMQLIQKRKVLRAQIDKLEVLPIGADAFQEDLDKLIVELEKSRRANEKEQKAAAAEEAEAAELYDSLDE